MTTTKQTKANRKNATKSTGPKTTNGKLVVAQNAIKHGLNSNAPVVLTTETWEEWESFRSELYADLAPQGALEQVLAERIVQAAWRLQRVVRYEALSTMTTYEKLAEELDNASPPEGYRKALGLASAPEQRLAELRNRLEEFDYNREGLEQTAGLLRKLPELPEEAPWSPDPEQLLNIGAELMPDDYDYDSDPKLLHALDIDPTRDSLWDYRWDVGMVRETIRYFAPRCGASTEELIATIADRAQSQAGESRRVLEGLRNCEKSLIAEVDRKKARLAKENLIPNTETVQKITRYESHLSKQMYQALHELQRLQASRDGKHVSAPAALDVTVHTNEVENPKMGLFRKTGPTSYISLSWTGTSPHKDSSQAVR